MSQPLEQIFESKESLKKWVQENPLETLQASAQDFSNFDFSGLSLIGVNFQGCNLTGANFTGCSLYETNFRSATLDQSIFRNAILDRAILRSVECTAADFSECEGTGVNALSATFAQSKFVNSKFLRGDFENAEFRDCNLSNVNFSHARLLQAKLSESVLNGANFSRAELAESIWRNAKVNKDTNFALADWTERHDPARDGQEEIILSQKDDLLNWTKLRFIGSIPLFSGSSILLVGSLFFAL